jgi:hypothetical protein
MRRLGLVLTCLVLTGAPALLGAGASLAASSPGCSGSAGDQQYVDPLGCPTTSTSSAPPPTTPTTTPAQQTPTTPTTTPAQQTPTPSATVASATTTTPTAADPKSSSGKLPYTGLEVWPAVALGVALFGAGVALRRSALAS